jgi:hypothetical protein
MNLPFTVDDAVTWVRATTNLDLLRQLYQTVQARLSELQNVVAEPQGLHLNRPHVLES